MGATSIGTVAKQEVRWSIIFSILMIVAGVLAIIVPPAAGLAVTAIVGWLLIFSGGAHLVFGWYTRTRGGIVWEWLMGVLYILVGGYLLFHLAAGLASLTIVLAVYLFFGAAVEFALFFTLRPLPGFGWEWEHWPRHKSRCGQGPSLRWHVHQPPPPSA